MSISEILMNVRQILVSQWSTMLIIIVFFLILIIFRKLRKAPIYEYPLRDSVMTPTEFKFFETLLMVVDKKYHVFPQIHFDRIFKYEFFEKKNRLGAFRHINQKSVDFLLCDLINAKPLLIIELDDWRHEKWENIKEKDKKKEFLFEEAMMPFLRKKVGQNYNKEELAREIENKIDNGVSHHL